MLRKLLPYAYILMILVIFILPFFSAEGYTITEHTTSQLAAQSTRNSWIMNLIFVLLGIFSITDTFPRLENLALHKVLIIVFGLSLVMTAIFSHAPITEGIEFSQREDTWHSNFASIAGFGFSTFAIAAAFIESKKTEKILAFSTGITATLLSLLFFLLPNYAGVWQRIIFIGSFAWLIHFSKPTKYKKQ